jgi:hypothetical protein
MQIPASGSGLTLSPNVLALAYETQFLIHPDDAASAARLLAIYTHPRYVRTFLTPQWAYKAGVVVLSEQLQKRQQQQFLSAPSSSSPLSSQCQGQGAATAWEWSATAAEAYGNCLLVLEQTSQRWSSGVALKRSIQSFVSSSPRLREEHVAVNGTEVHVHSHSHSHSRSGARSTDEVAGREIGRVADSV